MNNVQGRRAAIITVNMQLLAALMFGGVAWLIWPQTAEWWGLGLLSILCGLAALSAVGNAMRTATGLYRKEKMLAAYFAQGGDPKSARLASTSDLKRAGMVQ